MLCGKCSNILFQHIDECSGLVKKILPRRHDNVLYYVHHESLNALRKSSNDGCHFCAMILDRLSFKDNRWSELPASNLHASTKSQVVLYMSAPDLSNWFYKGAPIFVRWQDREAMTTRLGEDLLERQRLDGYKIDPSAGKLVHEMLHALTACKISHHGGIAEHGYHANQAARLESPEPVRSAIDCNITISDCLPAKAPELYSPWNDRSTTSLSNMALAAYWLDSCMHKHKICEDFATQGPLPQRIIDIRDPQRPVLADGSGKHDPYVVLSYKWGAARKYLTTTRNLAEHTTHGIPLMQLPQTFKDAIFVASSLRFRWLWIDALCICQDLQEELSQQIRAMDVIFQTSALAIFATAGDNADSGLTSIRDPRWIKPCKLTIKVTLYEQYTKESTYILFQDRFNGDESSQILYSRGWVLQEQILSHRALMFEGRQIRWRCLCSTACESTPIISSTETHSLKDVAIPTSTGLTYPEGFDGFNHLRVWLQQKNPMPDRHQHLQNNHFNAWYSMITNYSNRDLTSEADGLSALTGLEKAFTKTHKCTYYAGLWKEDLQAGLSWYVAKYRGVASDASSRSPPSWSWVAQRPSEIRFFTGHDYHTVNYDEGIRVLDISIDKDHKALRDTITPQRLRITGKLRKLQIEPESLVPIREYALLWPSESHLLENAEWCSRIRDIETHDHLGLISFDSDPATNDLGDNRHVYCLLSMVLVGSNQRILVCLALVPTDVTLKKFKRIGLITLHTPSWFGLAQDTRKKYFSAIWKNARFRETITIV